MINNNTTYKCKICGISFKTIRGFVAHIVNMHHIKIQQYYDTYLKKENDGICINCGTPTKFTKLTKGYEEYCPECKKKMHYENVKKSVQNKYGVDNVSQVKEINEKISASHKNRTVDEKQKSSELRKETCLKKYGVEYVTQQTDIKKSMQDTKLKRYNNINYNNRQQSRKTCINKYGVENPMQFDDVKKKSKQTNLEKRGVEWVVQSSEFKEKTKQTNLEKYGVENISQSNEIKDKKKQTTLKHFGVENPAQSNEIKEKIKQTNLKKYGVENYMQLSKFKDKIKRTNLEKYGAAYYFQSDIYLQRFNEIQHKRYETMKKNGTFNTSKIEDLFEQYLKNNNYQYKRQYKSNDYPFNCDFYVSDYDLYIELNAHWTHGEHPFNKTNENDIQTLNEWKNKNTEFYNNAIEVWTIRDVNKLKVAKKHNLNYLVIYSNDINEVIQQFNHFIDNTSEQKYYIFCKYL